MPRGSDAKKRATWKAEFLAFYRELGRVDLAAKKVGIDRGTVYEWRKKDETFAAEFAEVQQYIAEMLEDECFRRAYDGTTKPVYQNGRKVGAIQEYSDTLGIFLLKALRPEKYRERYDVKSDSTVKHAGEVKIYIPDNGRGSNKASK